MTTGQTVSDLSEEQLLGLLFPRLPRGRDTLLGPGDDAAVLAAPDGRVVVSTDVLVEGRHFRRAWSGGADVGHRAAMQNLADIAAMGARPTGLVVALVAPADLPVDWVVGLADGLGAACGPHGVGVVGGDLSGGEEIVVAVTVHGDLGGRDPVLRSGARPGDVVAHAGTIGQSAAGLALRLAAVQVTGPAATTEAVDRALDGYLRPVTPLAAGPAAASAGATAMLDVSDGLVRDAGRIARASGVQIAFDPVARAFAQDLAGLRPVADLVGADPVGWLLAGGEDHGLLATFPSGADLPTPFRPVGTVRADGAVPVTVGGAVPTRGDQGWDHFAGRPQPLR